LATARFIEPAGLSTVQLANSMGLGPNIGMKKLRDERHQRPGVLPKMLSISRLDLRQYNERPE
jgi:hypothetical protein